MDGLYRCRYRYIPLPDEEGRGEKMREDERRGEEMRGEKTKRKRRQDKTDDRTKQILHDLFFFFFF